MVVSRCSRSGACAARRSASLCGRACAHAAAAAASRRTSSKSRGTHCFKARWKCALEAPGMPYQLLGAPWCR